MAETLNHPDDSLLLPTIVGVRIAERTGVVIAGATVYYPYICLSVHPSSSPSISLLDRLADRDREKDSYQKHRGFGDPIDISSGEDPDGQWTRPWPEHSRGGNTPPPPLSLPTRHRRDEHRGPIGAPVSVSTRSWPIRGERRAPFGGGCSPLSQGPSLPNLRDN